MYPFLGHHNFLSIHNTQPPAMMSGPISPPTATPKRKRDDLMADGRLSVSPTPHAFAKNLFSFRPPNLQPVIRSEEPAEDGNNSPRSKVAQKFRDLAIRERSGEGPKATTGGCSQPESGGGASIAVKTPGWMESDASAAPDITRFNFDARTATAHVEMQLDSDDEGNAASRKRAKTGEPNILSSSDLATNELAGETASLGAQTVLPDSQINDRLSVAVDPKIVGAIGISGSGSLSDPKSRNRRRMGTPPLSSRRRGNNQAMSAKEGRAEQVIVDPVRAALTWREDEITVYDPEDKDDDGTGINGIGFKPTAAVAYQRSQKRRQQLADYKRREEVEARAKRSQRRREQLSEGAEMARKDSIARVHFSDAPPATVMMT